MKQYKVVVLDFDGTLVKTRKFVIDYTTKFIAKNNLTDREPSILFTDLNNNQTNLSKELVSNFWEGYAQTEIDTIEVFEDVTNILKKIKQSGTKLAIFSNRNQAAIQKILLKNGLLKFFDLIIGDKEVTKHKPDPEALLICEKVFNAKPDEMLFIGNHQEDMEAGLTANVGLIYFADRAEYFEQISKWLIEKNIRVIKSYHELLAEF